MSTVLIIGASRGIGFEIVKLALKAGHSVRALVRSASAIRLRAPKLEKLDGDARDQHTIERALEGVDAVIQTLGVSPTPELILGGTRLFSVATRILVDAMEARTKALDLRHWFGNRRQPWLWGTPLQYRPMATPRAYLP